MQSFNIASILLLVVIVTLATVEPVISHENRTEVGYTSVQVDRLVYTWYIENLEDLIRIDDANIYSPSFFTRNGSDEWVINFQFKGKSIDKASLVLRLVSSKNVPVPLNTYAYMDESPESFVGPRVLAHAYVNQTYGWPNFANYSKLMEYMNDSDLVLRFYITVVGNVTTYEPENGKTERAFLQRDNGEINDNKESNEAYNMIN